MSRLVLGSSSKLSWQNRFDRQSSFGRVVLHDFTLSAWLLYSALWVQTLSSIDGASETKMKSLNSQFEFLKQVVLSWRVLHAIAISRCELCLLRWVHFPGSWLGDSSKLNWQCFACCTQSYSDRLLQKATIFEFRLCDSKCVQIICLVLGAWSKLNRQ